MKEDEYMANNIDLKQELAEQASKVPAKKDEEVKLTKSMTIPDMAQVLTAPHS